ncbi:proteasome endopeptidase complex, archaeal, beta subunit [Candidatus Bathyarchaeota archaeon ex4484_231]|nr:MAG: proteasome endopeptidase complex, archaeal, beta subunit [Candidatus Bathyarchaeota archaeon ex4484_231]RJS76315.1 MAG: archaeal proteasome endopeptidase complex subunit beta [Candidatus Bathyarchaeota archaeon]
MKEEQSQYLYVPGATTVGVVCKDGVILASEKRVSYGSFVVSRAGKKIFKITENIGAACAGLVSDMQILVREVEAYANLFKLEVGRRISVKAAAKMMSNLLFSRRLFPLITQTIVGGIDDEGPTLYVLDVLGSNIPDKYTAVGSGAEIAIGVLEEAYREDMTVEEGKELVTSAVKSAISRDAMSGDGIDFLIIKKDGIKEETLKF